MNFIDLQEQYRRYKAEIHEEMDKVLSTAAFINGPAVAELEAKLAEHVRARHAIACSSGTDALLLGLMAKGVGPGDEIIVPDFTFIATAEVVSLLGATPVFADVQDDTLNIDPESIRKVISANTKGIIPVSLYGQCVDIEAVQALADEHALWVMEDGAQSFGATRNGVYSCAMSELATTSFFPAKPLGCYGDGGAVFTSDQETAQTLRVLRNHGQRERYRHSRIGVNGRLDTLQAAVLLVKLRHFDEEMEQKQKVADWYAKRLGDAVRLPTVRSENRSVWAQYTIRSSHRDQIARHLKEKGIPSAIHYPLPLHRQEVYLPLAFAEEDFPVASLASREVLSLPMHPFMTESEVDMVSRAVIEAVGAGR